MSNPKMKLLFSYLSTVEGASLVAWCRWMFNKSLIWNELSQAWKYLLPVCNLSFSHSFVSFFSILLLIFPFLFQSKHWHGYSMIFRCVSLPHLLPFVDISSLIFEWKWFILTCHFSCLLLVHKRKSGTFVVELRLQLVLGLSARACLCCGCLSQAPLWLSSFVYSRQSSLPVLTILSMINSS